MIDFVKNWRNLTPSEFSDEMVQLYQIEKGIYNKHKENLIQMREALYLLSYANKYGSPAAIRIAEEHIERLVAKIWNSI